MPTDSIFHHVVIDTEEGVEKLLEALEASEEDLKNHPKERKVDEAAMASIREMMIRGLSSEMTPETAEFMKKLKERYHIKDN